MLHVVECLDSQPGRGQKLGSPWGIIWLHAALSLLPCAYKQVHHHRSSAQNLSSPGTPEKPLQKWDLNNAYRKNTLFNHHSHSFACLSRLDSFCPSTASGAGTTSTSTQLETAMDARAVFQYLSTVAPLINRLHGFRLHWKKYKVSPPVSTPTGSIAAKLFTAGL